MAFDPDAYLAQPHPAAAPATADVPAAGTRATPATPAPTGFNPDAWLASNPAPKASPSTLEAVGRGALQGVTLGFGDEITGAVQSLFGPKTYAEYRDEARANNAAASTAHPFAYGAGEVGGGLATSVVPGLGALKGATALKTGLQAAALGGATALGSSEATNAADLAKDTAKGAAIGGVGGALLHATASKVGELLARAPEAVDQQAVKGLVGGGEKAGAALSKAKGVVLDENTPKVINDPVKLDNGKTTTLSQMAYKPAEEVRPVLAAQRDNYLKQIDPIYKAADNASGGVRVGDLVKHYDAQIAKYGSNPMNEPFVNELEKAKASVLKSWGPDAESVASKQGEIGQGLDKVYDKADKASGGVRVGDLVKHYDDEIARLEKTPGNQAFIRGLQEARDDVTKAWGTADKLNPGALVKGGTFEGQETGKAVALLERMKAANPEHAEQLQGEIDRITKEATGSAFDPEARIPSKEVRSYATTLQDRGASSVENPSVGQQARKMLGSTTRDFVNGHVENTLGTADRKALEGLNGRMSNLYKVDDAMAGGKNADPAVRDAILKEFDRKLPAGEVSKLADALEERGTDQIDRLNPGLTTQAKRELGNTTRDFLNQHVENTLSGNDLAKVKDLNGRMGSLKKIDRALEDRVNKEAAGRISGGGLVSKLVGHAGLGGAAVLAAHGNIPGAVASLVAPKAIESLPAAGRFATRRLAGANSLLERVVDAAANGNPWAQRQIQLLRSTPAGIARLAQMQGPSGAASPGEATAPESTGPAMAAR